MNPWQKLAATLLAAEDARLDGDEDVARNLDREGLLQAFSLDVSVGRLRRLRRQACRQASERRRAR